MNRFGWIAMAMAGVSGAALLAVGCSGDDATGPAATDGGPDATTDATSQDSAADQSASDAPADQTTTDAADAADAGSDGGTDAAVSCTPYDAAGLDAASVEAGFEAVWQVYKCYSCHQNDSQLVDDAGDGIVLSGNNDGLGDSGTIFPPNLTPDPTTGLGCWSDPQIVNAILQGKLSDGGMLCPSMPLWGDALTMKDGGPKPGTPMSQATAQTIVDFLRTLPSVVNAVPKTTCATTDAGGDGGDAAAADASDGATGASDGASDASDGASDASDGGGIDASDAADGG